MMAETTTYPIYSAKFTSSADGATLEVSGQKTGTASGAVKVGITYNLIDSEGDETEDTFLFDNYSQALDFATSIIDTVFKAIPEVYESASSALKIYKPHVL